MAKPVNNVDEETSQWLVVSGRTGEPQECRRVSNVYRKSLSFFPSGFVFIRSVRDNSSAMASTSRHRGSQDQRSADRSVPTVLVLGGSGVIGSAIGLRFAGVGWNVGLHYHTNHASTDAVLRTIAELGGQGKSFQADMKHPHRIHALFEQVHATWQELDACLWCVGQPLNRVTLRTTPSAWDHVLRVNLTGLFLCMQKTIPLFSEQRGGSITVIGSLSGDVGGTGQTAYAACKAGAIGFVKSAARELGHTNVRVNAVFPGWQRSPLAGEAYPNQDKQRDHVLTRTPALDEVADLIYRVATAHDVSGQVYNLDNRIW